MMTKYIQKLFNALRIELLMVWLLWVIVIVLGEVDVIPNGIIAPKSNEEFVLTTTAIVLTVVGIPLAIRLFTLNTTKGLRRMDNDEALNSYHIWSLVRMGILCLVALFCTTVYYLTMNVSGAVLALVAMVVTLYCWPSKEKIAAYLESVQQ
ncbi:MAG: hypothetical protein GXY64_04175 [Bacteroidales bacterium]|nr:hypothetical protein [Bacteroidales bacterium]